MRHSIALFASALAILTLAGCGGGGPTLYPVQGTVTVGGAPTSGVNVTFAPIDGRQASAARTNSEGKFVLLFHNGRAGALPGKHKVLLSLQPETQASMDYSDPAVREKMMKDRGSGTKDGKKGAPAASGKKSIIPADYSNSEKTTLEFEVKPSSNNFEVPVP